MAEEQKEAITEEEPKEEPKQEAETEQAEEPRQEAEPKPEEKDEIPERIPPSPWMQELLKPRDEEPPVSKPREEEQPREEKDEETILGEAEMRAIARLVDARTAILREENEALRKQMQQTYGRDVRRETQHTIDEVYQRTYQDVFRNDPDFRGNPEVARTADAIVGNWVSVAMRIAQETGDTNNLEWARSQEFGELALANAKVICKVGRKGSAPVVPKGAEVEDGRSSRAPQPRNSKGQFIPSMSVEDREQLEKWGVTQQAIEESQEYFSNASMEEE